MRTVRVDPTANCIMIAHLSAFEFEL
eukprot:COSAG06_NODE_56838_length_283_cov_0.505435_2_plen_25_part_01